jgi:hypothetical protein
LTQLDVRPAPAEAVRIVDSPVHHDRLEAVRWIALAVVVVLISGLAAWVISPRFAIDTPSLVDDWAAIDVSPDQLSSIARMSNPEDQRFRPGWILWNYVQWHTLDAPQGLVGPNVWNVLRIIVLVAGLSLLTALALPRPRDLLESVLHAGLAGIPALVTVTAPKFAVDLTRFGPQEPLLLGGMALGGSLLVLVGRQLLNVARPVVWPKTVTLGVVGSALWVVGAYQKETSLAALPLIAAVLVAGRLRFAAWRALSGRRRTVLAGLAAVVALPFAHVAVESLRITLRGDLVYDADVDGGATAAKGVNLLYRWAHEALPQTSQILVIGAVVLTLLAVLVRQKLDWVALGALASGALSIALAGQAGVVATRYYIPAFALAAVALSLSFARFSAIVQVVGLLGIVFSVLPAQSTRAEVRLWTEWENRTGRLVRTIADVNASGCVVAAAGLDVEPQQGLPVLVALEGGSGKSECEGRPTYFVTGQTPSGDALLRACAPRRLMQLYEAVGFASLYRCDRLATERVRDPEIGRVAPAVLVEFRRLRS